MSLGRLVTAVDDEAHVFPVNFVVQNRTVLFRTAAGTKLISAAINNQVVFEADDHTAAEGWSVIVRGVARTLRTDEETGGRRAGAVTAVDGDGENALCPGVTGPGHRSPLPASGLSPQRVTYLDELGALQPMSASMVDVTGHGAPPRR